MGALRFQGAGQLFSLNKNINKTPFSLVHLNKKGLPTKEVSLSISDYSLFV